MERQEERENERVGKEGESKEGKKGEISRGRRRGGLGDVGQGRLDERGERGLKEGRMKYSGKGMCDMIHKPIRVG